MRLRNSQFLKLIPLAAIFLLGCNSIRVKNYYIPYNFEGNVAIIYNNTENENQYQEIFNYDILQNGIVYLESSFPDGKFVVSYYQKNRNNGYDTLSVEEASIKLDSSRNRIYFPRILSFSKGESKPIIVTTFYVGKKKTIELANDRVDFERKLEAMLFGKDNVYR